MFYYIGCLVFAILSAFTMNKVRVENVYSKVIFILVTCSLISNISLSQNYTQSLMLEINDGIGISNKVAFWIIGEGNWSQERFRILFEQSIIITIFLLFIYVLTMVIEKKLKKSS